MKNILPYVYFFNFGFIIFDNKVTTLQEAVLCDSWDLYIIFCAKSTYYLNTQF